MKRISIICMLLFGMFMTSCSKTNTPEFVAEKFLTAMEQANYEEAKKYCDEKTAQIISMVASVPAQKDKEPAKKVTITNVEKNKDDKNKAKVFYLVEGEEKEKSIDVVKIDGKWKVSMDKENKENGHGHDHGHLDGDNNHNHESDSLQLPDASTPGEAQKILDSEVQEMSEK